MMPVKLVGMFLLVIGAASIASATAVPEIDPGTGMNAIALLGGALLIVRSRKR
jgi:hypothetical protein